MWIFAANLQLNVFFLVLGPVFQDACERTWFQVNEWSSCGAANNALNQSIYSDSLRSSRVQLFFFLLNICLHCVLFCSCIRASVRAGVLFFCWIFVCIVLFFIHAFWLVCVLACCFFVEYLFALCSFLYLCVLASLRPGL